MAASQDEDLQELFCSLACLSGVVFTSLVIGNCLSCKGVEVCVSSRIYTMTFPQRQRKGRF